MPKRFSGEVEVSILWSDSEEQYAAKVTAPDHRPEFVVVGAPAVLEVAVDSPKAYDSAAKAAISHAESEPSGAGIGNHAAYYSEKPGDLLQLYIGRSKKTRWPCCH